MIAKERKELFAGSAHDCHEWRNDHPEAERMEIVTNTTPGPTHSVFWKRKDRGKEIARPLTRETRERFRVQGVTKEPTRPLLVSLLPGDVISFRPKGTRQAVTVPIASLYHFARMTAARAIANAKRQARKARKAAR